MSISRTTTSPESPIRVASKPATIEDVARQAGVALSTASGAFSGKKRMSPATRENILRVAQSLDFEPNHYAQRLSRTKAQNLVGIFTPYLDTSVTTSKVRRIQHLLSLEGFEVPVYTCGAAAADRFVDRQKALLNAVRRQKPESLICFTGSLGDEAIAELVRYQENHGTLVCFDHNPFAATALACDQVTFDREDNSGQAVEYLHAQGHRNIGFYFHGNDVFAHVRRVGFEEAMCRLGLSPTDSWAFEGIPDSERYEESAVRMAAAFLALPCSSRPTALCGMPDLLAAALVSAIHEQSNGGVLVPRDVSVVATDDTPLTRYSAVPLTTTTHPVEKIAQAVAAMVMTRLSGDKIAADLPPRHVVVRGELVVRNSTRRLDEWERDRP